MTVFKLRQGLLKKFLGDWLSVYRLILNDTSISLTLQKILLGLIVLSCITVRLWTIQAPALDRTAWKEIDYIALSSNYWKHGFNFFYPELTWPAEAPRVTEMEFPLVPYLAGVLYQLLGFNVYSVRLITLLSFVILTIYVFRLAKRELGPIIGLLAALAAFIMPLYHFFGHLLFSEPLMIAMSVVALFHFAEWIDFQRRRDWVLAMVGLSLAIALKLEPLYLLLPLFGIAFRKYKWDLNRYRDSVILVLCALILPLLWYSYAYYLENVGIHAFGIFKGHNKSQTLTMLSNRGWYRTMYYRITKGILGGQVGTFLCLLGLIMAAWLRQGGLFFAYLLAIGIYFILIAEGNLDAPYRQLTIIPVLSVFVALGAMAIQSAVIALITSFRSSVLLHRRKIATCLIGSTLLICLIAVQRGVDILGRDPGEPSHPERWEFAQVIKKYAQPGSKLAVAGEYDLKVGGNDISPVLYYYTDLQGWTLQPPDWNLQRIETLIQKGATHFIAIPTFGEPDSEPFLREESAEFFLQEMKARYPVLYEGKKRLILDLRQSKDSQ